jgi:hypothetical protein
MRRAIPSRELKRSDGFTRVVMILRDQSVSRPPSRFPNPGRCCTVRSWAGVTDVLQ